jgi:hypothetical protein
MLFLF